mgnify:CR=1 FL=1
MAIKPIITSIILLVLIIPMFSIAVDCNDKFYFYKYQYVDESIKYLGRSLEKGCVPGNVQEDFYNLNIIKGDSSIYSYGFNPKVMHSDALNKANEITGGAELIQDSTINIPVPVADYDKISVTNEEGTEINALTKAQIDDFDKKKNSEQFSLTSWVDNLVKNVMNVLFNR